MAWLGSGHRLYVRYTNPLHPLQKNNGEAVKVMVTEGTVKVFADIGRISKTKLNNRLTIKSDEPSLKERITAKQKGRHCVIPK